MKTGIMRLLSLSAIVFGSLGFTLAGDSTGIDAAERTALAGIVGGLAPDGGGEPTSTNGGTPGNTSTGPGGIALPLPKFECEYEGDCTENFKKETFCGTVWETDHPCPDKSGCAPKGYRCSKRKYWICKTPSDTERCNPWKEDADCGKVRAGSCKITQSRGRDKTYKCTAGPCAKVDGQGAPTIPCPSPKACKK